LATLETVIFNVYISVSKLKLDIEDNDYMQDFISLDSMQDHTSHKKLWVC